MNERVSFDRAFLIWCGADSDLLLYTVYVLITFESPWYDLCGWLGVKNQLPIYLSIYLSIVLLLILCSPFRRAIMAYWIKFPYSAFMHHQEVDGWGRGRGGRLREGMARLDAYLNVRQRTPPQKSDSTYIEAISKIFGCLLGGAYVPCINRMPSGLCRCVSAQCATSIVRT